MNSKILNTPVLLRLNVNIARTIVIIFSLTIALVCLMISGFVSYTAKETDTLQFANTNKNTVFANVENSEIYYGNVDKIGAYFTGSKYNFFSENDLGDILIGQTGYSFKSLEVGKLQEKMILPSFDQYGATEYTRLIGGRLINDNDINLNHNAILVHEAIGEFIFGCESKIIGEKIDFNGDIYEVVGVLSNSPDILRMIKQFNQNDNFYISNWTKIPIVRYGGNSLKIKDVLFFFDGAISLSTLQTMQSIINNSAYENVFLTTAEEQIARKSYNGTNSSGIIDISLNIVTIILCIISTIIIFMSIKERVSEIAVRKSFGATTLDIITMFLDEILICLFLSICYSLSISTIIMVFISKSVSNNINTTIFPLNLDIYLFPMAIITLSICIISLIPLLVFGKSKIVNLLKVS